LGQAGSQQESAHCKGLQKSQRPPQFDGTAAGRDGAIAIAVNDDLTERWTSVGKSMGVENEYSSSRWPCGEPLLGVADRGR
jgi:hypothetical protein